MSKKKCFVQNHFGGLQFARKRVPVPFIGFGASHTAWMENFCLQLGFWERFITTN